MSKQILQNLALAIVVLAGFDALAIEGWRVVPKAVWDKDFQAVAFAGEDTVWAVGNDGLIIHSTNGGFVWMTQNSGTTADLYDAFFVDWLTGWAVGESGKIFFTDDGGFNWKSQASKTTANLYGVHFINRQIGWAAGAGGTLLRTADGGKTWERKSSGTTNDLSSVFFIDAQTGLVTESYYYYTGKIRRTTDGGATWNPQHTVSQYLEDITFADGQNGWVVGSNGVVLRTTNGGANWSSPSSGTSDYLYSVHFNDTKTGWAVGNNGRVISTSDGGGSWKLQISSTSNLLYGVAVTKSGKGLLVGRYGTVIGTQDFGTNWKSRNHGTNYHLRRVAFADSLHGWAVGNNPSYAYEGVIMSTKDGGETWYTQYSANTSLYDVFCTDSVRIWAVGSGGLVVHSSNGGVTWSKQITETTGALYDVYFIDVLHGWISGASSHIEFTTDGGIIWRPTNFVESKIKSYGQYVDLYGLYMVNADTGWACGDYGIVLHTTDSGQSWWIQNTGFTGSYDYFAQIFFLDAQIGWTAGGYSYYSPPTDGRVIFTNDGGKTWKRQTLITTKGLEGIDFIDANRGWAVGAEGRIIYTKDGGAQWDFDYSRTTANLKDVYFTDARHGWAVGDGGVVLKYEGGLRYWADVNDDAKVNVVDIQLVASRWGYKIGNPGYGKIYDVNNQGVGDGKIDIIDIQLVANEWGWPNTRKKSSAPAEPATSLIAALVPTGVDAAGNFLFELRAEGAAGLTGFEWSFSFDPAQVQFAGMELGSLLRADGQNSFALGPQETTPGQIVLGGFSLTEMQQSSGALAVIKIKATSADQINLRAGELLVVDRNAETKTIGLTTGVASSPAKLPEKYALWQNYPNPFNPSTTIRYAIPASGHVTLKVFDLLGKEIATLVNEKKEAGEHAIQWQAAGLPSAVYVYRLEAGEFVETRKFVLLK